MMLDLIRIETNTITTSLFNCPNSLCNDTNGPGNGTTRPDNDTTGPDNDTATGFPNNYSNFLHLITFVTLCSIILFCILGIDTQNPQIH